MNQKSLRTLEYYKIISQLTEYASSQLGKELCRNLVPSTSLAEISQTLQETTDAVTRVRQKGSLSFGGIRDIRDSLRRLDVGSSLGIVELLAVSALLTGCGPGEELRPQGGVRTPRRLAGRNVPRAGALNAGQQ